jgi:Relaxase/Mobilisation nuclease domain/RepB DNA-primase from phage plasmid
MSVRLAGRAAVVIGWRGRRLHTRPAMIGKPIKGRSFRGVLDYLAGRDGAALVGGNMEGRTPRELAREFAFSRSLRPRLGKAVCHIPLRLPYDERLSVEQWQRIGERVVAGMGFEDCSYALYLHPQSPRGEHLHIVASRVTHLGHCVDDSFDMERLMRIERRIEKDYGLREVPYRKTAARRPGRGEHQLRARTGQASERERLQVVVGAAARPGVAVAELVAELERRGVELRPAITSTGRVNGMRYRLGEHTFSGSSLGADFSWPGLLGRRGLEFEPARDLPALVAAGRRFDAGAAGAVVADARVELAAAAPGAGAGAAVAGGPGAEGGSIAGDGAAGTAGQAGSSSPRGAGRGGRPDTADQVARQLAALGSPRYDVLVLQVATGEQLHHRSGLTPPGVGAAIPWLKHLNAYGCEILVRPSAPAGLTHFEGVHLAALREAGAAGFQPAAVLRAPDGGREVWMRGGADLPPAVQDLVDRELARRLRPGRPAQSPGYGHLAGFTSPFAQRAGGLERPPFLTLEEDGGRVYGGFRALAAESRARAAAAVLEERAEREIAGLGLRGGAAVGVGAGAGAGGDGAGGGAAGRTAAAGAASARLDSGRLDSGRLDSGRLDSAHLGSGRLGSPRAGGEVAGPGRPGAVPESVPVGSGGTARAAAGRPSSRQAALREMLAITDREAERRGLAGPPRPPSAGEIEERLARWGAARAAHAEALEAAGREVRDGSRGAAPYRHEALVVATFRAQEAIRHELAERLGVREVRADLPAGAALALARWQSSLAGAEERLDRLLLEPGATASDRLEGAIAVRTLREELADAAREHGLALREPVPGVAPAGLAAGGEPARAGAAAELGMGPAAAVAFPAPSEVPAAALRPTGEGVGTPAAAELGADPPAAAALPALFGLPAAGLESSQDSQLEQIRPEAQSAAAVPVPSELPGAAGQPAQRSATDPPRAEPQAAAELPAPSDMSAAALQGSRGSHPEQAGPEPRAAAGQAAGPAAARSMDTPDDEDLVLAYDDAAIPYSAVRHAAGWREQLAAELGLEEREAALRAELLVLERAHERASLLLDGLESRIERQPTSAREAAHQTLVGALLDLEERQVPLAERIAYLANHRVGREVGRLERILEREPTREGIAALTRLLDERRQVAPRLEEFSSEHVELRALGESGQPRVQLARHRFDRAVEGLLERPSLRAVQGVEDRHVELRVEEDIAGREAAAGELRAARKELHRAGDALLAAAAERPGEGASAAEVGPLRRALERYQAAETAVAGRLEAAATAADATRGDVGTLVAHLERGDLSPGTLARLQRAIGRELRVLGEPAGPLPRSPAAASLSAAVAAWKAGRADLRAAVRSFPESWRAGADGAALRRLRDGVARCQAAAAELDRQVQGAARTAESRALAPRFFLDHEAFAGQPHRAVAAWSAHAAERGVEPARIPEALARSGGARMASPRLLSSHYGFFLAAAATRVGLTLFHHYANEP